MNADKRLPGRMALTDGGVAQVLRMSLPLIIASSGHALRLFADRVMLARYSPTSIAAAMPAGLAAFCLTSFFIGISSYASAFVAQYAGAREEERAGAAIWQGLYIALVGGVLVSLCSLLAVPLFDWMNHGAEIAAEQVVYFQSLTQISVAGIMLAAISGFWSGRGRTGVVMGIELLCTLANLALNWLLIYGRAGFPELGILGAGLATGLSNAIGLVVALALFFGSSARRRFGTFPKRTFDARLMKRLLRYGSPSGIQFAMDMIAFNVFVVFLGRFGAVELEAANIAFSVNAIAFLPLDGLGATISILVGHGVGSGQIGAAQRAVRSTLSLMFLYCLILGILFVAAPYPALALFARAGDVAQERTLRLAAHYLRYIAAYLCFDGMWIVYSHAIRSAGDTRYAMNAQLVLSWAALVAPAFVAYLCGAPAEALWAILVAHVALAGLLFRRRYRRGQWMNMRVIEENPARELDLQVDRFL